MFEQAKVKIIEKYIAHGYFIKEGQIGFGYLTEDFFGAPGVLFLTVKKIFWIPLRDVEILEICPPSVAWKFILNY